MPQYIVTSPDGRKFKVNAPEGATQQDAINYIRDQQTKQPMSAEREKTGAVSAALQGVGQGVTFGLSDEAEGAIRGAYDAATSDASFSDAYAKRRDAARQRLDQAAEDNPVAYYGGELAGGVAVPGALAARGVATAGRVANAGLKARTIAAAKEGGKYGAVYGFGTGEGDATQQAASTVGGAVGGALAGGLMPGAVDLAAAGARRVALPFRGYSNPQGVAAEKYAEATARDMGASGAPQDIAAAANRIQARAASTAGDNTMMLADLGGENTRRLVRQAGDMPNDNVQRFNRRLDQRQNFQWKRIERELANTLQNPDDYAGTVDSIVSRRKAQADIDFKRAWATPTPVTPELKEVLSRPITKQLFDLTTENLANRGQQATPRTLTEQLHNLKLELDGQIATARTAQKMGNRPAAGWDFMTLKTVKDDLLRAIDNPNYKSALNNYAGESALKTAAEDGFESALKLPTEEISKTLARLSASEADMYRLGAARALAGKIRAGNVTRDRTESLFSSPDIQKRMEAIFPDQKGRRSFQAMLVREARKADTRKAVQGGSKTSQNLTTADEAGAPARAITAAAQAARGNVLDPVMTALGRAGNRFSGMTPATANALLEIAMRPTSAGLDPRVFNQLSQAAQLPIYRNQLANRLSAGSSSLAGPAGASALLGLFPSE